MVGVLQNGLQLLQEAHLAQLVRLVHNQEIEGAQRVSRGQLSQLERRGYQDLRR